MSDIPLNAQSTCVSEGSTSKGNENSLPNPEVKPKSSRRRFTSNYKLKILEEIELYNIRRKRFYIPS